METKHDRTPHPFFDALLAELRQRRGEGVRNNDAALCKLLDIQPPTLSKMRKSRLPISDTVRVRVMRTFNWTIKRLDALAPPESTGAQQ